MPLAEGNKGPGFMALPQVIWTGKMHSHPAPSWKTARLGSCTSDSISYWPLLPRAMVSKS